MHVYDSTRMYWLTANAGVMGELCLWSAFICTSTRACKGTLFGKKLCLINAQFSEASLLVVDWPNHGPGVDVEQGASRARGSLTVAHAQRIARILAAVHVPGNGAVVSCWNQGQFPQDVREWHDVQDRIGLGEIQKFGANLSSAWPPSDHHRCTLAS
jgi:hypothetical protein